MSEDRNKIIENYAYKAKFLYILSNWEDKYQKGEVMVLVAKLIGTYPSGSKFSQHLYDIYHALLFPTKLVARMQLECRVDEIYFDDECAALANEIVNKYYSPSA